MLVSYCGYRITTTCGKIKSLFLLVVQSIVCSTYLYREADISEGQLPCHHTYQGMLPLEGLSVSVTFVEYAYP